MDTVRVLVTGAGTGIGFELSRMLLRCGGYHVIAAAGRKSWSGDAERNRRDLGLIVETSNAQPAKPRSAVTFASLDVTDPASRMNLIDSVTRALGTQKLNVLVNNAGVYPSHWTAADFESALATNTRGPLALATELFPSFAEGAHVVNVSSGYGKLRFVSPEYAREIHACTSIHSLCSLPFREGDAQGSSAAAAAPAGDVAVPAYKVSKAALNRGTQLLAQQWQGQVRVNSVDPGWCSTAMGGPGAPRTAVQGAQSLFALVHGHPQAIGTGQFYSHDGKQTSWS